MLKVVAVAFAAFAVLASSTSTLTASSAKAPLPARPLMPASLAVSVTAASDIPNELVTEALREADAIWRAAGLSFEWDRAPRVIPAPLHVVIGGGVSPAARVMPLAWISFDDFGAPTSQIYLSHANALAFMKNSRETVGLVDAMTITQRHTYLARAMGRALAHEIGHFLLASKSHSVKGLMMASHTASEFFSPERKPFVLEPSQRSVASARFTAISVASRG